MIDKRNLIVVAISLLMGVGLLISCGGHSNSKEQDKRAGIEAIDSVVRAQLDQDSEGALAYIDSLEQTGEFSYALICYERGLVYRAMRQRVTSELYFKKALEGNDLLNESPVLFYRATDCLSASLSNHGNNAEALTVATRGYEVSSKDQSTMGRRWTSVILHSMGYFQAQLGMSEKAEENFSMAYMMLSQIVQADSCYENLRIRARVSLNILDAYTTTEQYDKALSWVTSAEEAAKRLSAHPDCTEGERRSYVGGVAIHKALVMAKAGAMPSAHEAYEKARSLGYFNSGYGIMEQASYLRKSEQWEELVHLMPQLDSLATKWNVPASLTYLAEYIVPQFNAYMLSGRKDKAMEMAEKMAASMDSVASYEQNHMMQEIAVIAAQKDQNTEAAKEETRVAYRWVKILSGALAGLLLCILGYAGFRFFRSMKHDEANN